MEYEQQDELIDVDFELREFSEFKENEIIEAWREILYRERGQHFDNYP